MATFNVINLSLGKIKAGTQHKVYFSYSGVQEIVKMSSPCDCSVPINEPANSRILIKYIPKNVSKHLTEMGIMEQAIKKVIHIDYIDQETKNKETILLSFTAVVKD